MKKNTNTYEKPGILEATSEDLITTIKNYNINGDGDDEELQDSTDIGGF